MIAYSKYHSQWEKAGSLSLKIRNMTRMPTLTIIILYSTRSPCKSNQTTKGINGIQINKEEVKLSLFTDDMILYMEKPRESTPKLLEVIKQFSNVAGYQINAQKSVAFLYTNNDTEEKEIRESIRFTIAPKIILYL